MSARRRFPAHAVLVSVAAAALVSPLIAAPFLAPASAERLPDGGLRSAGSAGRIESVWVGGPIQLATSSTVTAYARVVVPQRTGGTMSIRVDGRLCTSAVVAQRGRSTVQATCRATAGTDEIPSLPVTVQVKLERVAGGTSHWTAQRTAQRSVAVDDGPALPAAEAAGRWRALATSLHAATTTVSTARATVQTKVATRTKAAATGATSLYSSADLASAVWQQAQTTGWSSAATTTAISDLLATRKPDGGYGLAAAWDAYGDGTLNPPGTTYTVTTSGHVGWVLLAAHRNGALPADGLTSAIDAMLAMPRLNGGTCFAYSNSAADRGKPCVYNVSHGAAAFLTQARDLTSYRADEIDKVLLALRSRLTDGYDPATGYWVYMAGQTKAQDISHQVFTAKSVDIVDPSFGAIRRMMALPWWRQPGGMSQSAVDLGSAMMDVAKDCGYARSPAVLLAAERAVGASAPAFTRLGMAAVTDEIVSTCFADIS